MKPVVAILIFVLVLIAVLPLSASAAFQLVPCGGGGNPEPCEFKHLIILLARMINYLISAAGFVAMYQILSVSFALVTSVGNPEKIKKAKTGISNAVVGFAIVILAFVFVNLLANGIFGDPSAQKKWWSVECLYGGAGATDCLGGGVKPPP